MDRKQLYLALFEPDIADIDDQKVKNSFSKRPLDARTFNWICSDDGFLLLCKRIHDCYLRMTRNLQSIYWGLCELIQKDTYLPKKGKEELISLCNPQDQESLSRFVALCILCGNNNTNQEKLGVAAGDGGIGKTTFLHQMMLDEYMDTQSNEPDEIIPAQYKSGHPVPFFIELNRCPSNIHEWRDDTLQKSNFITRYIGQMLEGHLSMGAVGNDALLSIEKEFQRTPDDGKPRYLLLLDGFNEVRSSRGHSIRSELSNEITVLGGYPNVRIITTSRKTQAAYFAADFKNVKLIGLEEKDILYYLHECRIIGV